MFFSGGERVALASLKERKEKKTGGSSGQSYKQRVQRFKSGDGLLLYALHSVMCLSLYIYVYCTTRSSCVFSTSENPPSSRLRCALRYRELFWRERGDVSPRKRIGCLGQLCGNLALKLFYKHISPLPVLGVVLDAHLNFVHLTRIHPLCLSVDHEDGDATHTDQQPRYLETHRSYNYEDEPVRLFFLSLFFASSFS